MPERARYYQGAMDVDCLKSGQDYKDLKNSYVIFICIPDIFGKGLPVYTFENLCRQDTSVPLGDRALKYFFISETCDKLLNEEQRAFMRLVSGCKSSTSFTDRVSRLTEKAKQTTDYRRQYMEWERQKAYESFRKEQQDFAIHPALIYDVFLNKKQTRCRSAEIILPSPFIYIAAPKLFDPGAEQISRKLSPGDIPSAATQICEATS